MSSLPRTAESGNTPAVTDRRERLGPVSEFIERHYRHFNAASLNDAALAYIAHLESGGSMMMALAGAMSTAELGVSLAEMIRQGKVHAVCCTGANLEEDVFNLVAHSHYERLPRYRDLTPRGRAEAARPSPQPRDRHVHPRARSDAAHRERRARGMEALRREPASACFRTSSSIACCCPGASTITSRSTRPTAGCSPPRRRTCPSSCPDGKTRRSATSTPPTASRARSRTCTRCGRGSST